MTEPRIPDQPDDGAFEHPADLAAVARDDDLVALLARGEQVGDDATTQLLSDLREALDDAYDASGLDDVPLAGLAPTGRVRARRGLVVVGGALTVALSLTGAAAAVGGDTNPVRRAITDIVDPSGQAARDIGRYLDKVEEIVSRARADGRLDDSDERKAAKLLARAEALLPRVADSAREDLRARIAADRAALTTLAAELSAEDGRDDDPGADDDGTDGSGGTDDKGTDGRDDSGGADDRSGSSGSGSSGSGSSGSGSSGSGSSDDDATSSGSSCGTATASPTPRQSDDSHDGGRDASRTAEPSDD